LQKIVRKKRYEYLYFYLVGLNVFGDERLKVTIFNKVVNDLSEEKKTIKDCDLSFISLTNENATILTTENLNSIFYQPLLLELYAFIKANKDYTYLSYPYEELKFIYKLSNQQKTDTLFNANNQEVQSTITILKFKIEC